MCPWNCRWSFWKGLVSWTGSIRGSPGTEKANPTGLQRKHKCGCDHQGKRQTETGNRPWRQFKPLLAFEGDTGRAGSQHRGHLNSHHWQSGVQISAVVLFVCLLSKKSFALFSNCITLRVLRLWPIFNGNRGGTELVGIELAAKITWTFINTIGRVQWRGKRICLLFYFILKFLPFLPRCRGNKRGNKDCAICVNSYT